ncbi:Bug family tripartite tricarboxylate transporter substrate binding protein [Aquabacterium sp. J223]|uniref:Bug family tripartite tricarboxylate transporter substrate binding protein n=1 Tax=Aquabacterium sp. J223 TaxID=2898431 RepID=UPI0021ADFC81|nr:Bug family tripartite tricarboxylate transporter substrate binding protein [Aquabacterium sp. J223]UUX95964.1 Bug family tripartite tricarboxylate transporter substrate binding protein [Aquabacterium sp. J223]
MTLDRRLLLQGAAGAALLGPAHRSVAQAGDSARIVVGFPAGGTADTMCRRLAERLQPGYAKSVLVENRTGAGAKLAVQAMKTLPPDGSAMLLSPMSMLCIYPHTYKNLGYDPVADLTPVSLSTTFEFGFCVGPAVPASVRNLRDFLAWAKANPEKANFASPAAGSVPHFIGVLLGRAADAQLTHVGYRGTGPAMMDLIGGQLAAVSGLIGDINAQMSSGRVRFLGVSGAQRSRFAPDVPTYAEQGFKDIVFGEWYAIYLPPGARPEVVRRLNTALVTALASPELAQAVSLMALEPASSTPAELQARIQAETERWGPIVRSIGFSADS